MLFTTKFYHDCSFAQGVLHSPGQGSIKVRGASNVPAPSKRDKQSLKRFEQNRAVNTRLKNLSKSFYRAVEAGDEGRARQLRDESQRTYDKAAQKGVIHPNKAARKVSRLDNALAGNE
jgi:small subunit ribosomal protein S20